MNNIIYRISIFRDRITEKPETIYYGIGKESEVNSLLKDIQASFFNRIVEHSIKMHPGPRLPEKAFKEEQS